MNLVARISKMTLCETFNYSISLVDIDKDDPSMLNNSTDDPIINRMYMFKNINLYSNYLRSDEEKVLSEEESNEIVKKFLLFSEPHKICQIIQ